MRTPMAMSSGRVSSGDSQEKFDQGEFTHALSGVRYRVYRNQNNTLFDYDFSGDETRIRGSRRLEYFVGSGVVGRSYLLSVDSFLYQAPVAYYSAQQRWRLSPGYEDRDHLYLTRPVGVTCLQCHASRLQPVPGTMNGFAAVPFLEWGISCETCHGPGEKHIGKFNSGLVVDGSGIVNPRRLSPERRDSVCAQCHLTGVARIDRAGRDRGSFQPGGLLSEFLSVFVWSGAPAEMTVTSHFEKIAQSGCKVKAGDRLSCGACHNPHSRPLEAEKARYFRGKCIECHDTPTSCKAPAALREREADNCVGCHMPKNPVTDVAHTVYTDHSIPRRVLTPSPESVTPDGILALFGGGTASGRDLGLAYALVAERDPNPVYRARAFELLKAAVGERSNDIPAMVQLAHLYGNVGEPERAIALYEKAVDADASQVVAANNLAAYRMQGDRTGDAIKLWSGVLARSPGYEAARMNLAVAQFRAGESESAQQTLVTGLELNPGSRAVRKLLDQFRTAVK
jgi:predicted CXXCH cytochrome family protein